jgi:DNA modification methylase
LTFKSTTRFLIGDCRTTLPRLPDRSVHAVVTSPPYYAQRDYGVSGQIGLAHTVDGYVASLVGVFREVKRVLRDDGTLWLNLGDSYAAKQRLLIPARVALALQDDGWYLRDEIVWSKSQIMPFSGKDRTANSHEMLYMFSKRKTYFYDQAAIKEQGVIPAGTRGAKGSAERFAQKGVNARPPVYHIYDGQRIKRSVWVVPPAQYREAHFAIFPNGLVEPCIRAGTSEHGVCRNCGSPWIRVSERPLLPTASDRPEAKRAIELYHVYGLTPAHILAIRSVGYADVGKGRDTMHAGNTPEVLELAAEAKAKLGGYSREFCFGATVTTGWVAGCLCSADRQPATVLDPFGGSGTVGVVAKGLRRRAILCELNPAYVELARARISQERL